jgi:hypothetical protein
MCFTCHKGRAKEREKRRYYLLYFCSILAFFLCYDKNNFTKTWRSYETEQEMYCNFLSYKDGWRLSHHLTLANIIFGKPPFGPIGMYGCEL